MSSFFGPVDRRKALSEHADDLARLVDGERRLRDVRDLGSVGQRERARLRDVLDQDGRVGRLAHRADDLLVPGVPDQHDGVPGLRVASGLHVDLGDERTGRVDHVVPEARGVRMHAGGDAVRRVDDRGAFRDLGLLLHEDRPSGLEIAHDVDVVDDLLADVDRRAVVLERTLHRLDGALDPGAVAAGRGEEDTLDHRPAKGTRCRGWGNPWLWGGGTDGSPTGPLLHGCTREHRTQPPGRQSRPSACIRAQRSGGHERLHQRSRVIFSDP